MPRFQDISIKRKLTAIIMIASTVALLVVSAGFVAYELVTFRKTMVGDLSTLGEVIGDRCTADLIYNTPDDANDTLHALHIEKHITAAALYD
ncbi:MAG TPA: hybrid sensor histidine kinase/response regulator, partial [Candidatus Polarisedimenticolia bacterium]|nr:hybrid sensor histidine kinase/response regulator [Candidatus Polarisedimenticolia bacterium]